MKYPTRIYYTETDKGLMWDRWQKGESLNSIARLFGRSHSSIQGVLVRTGGIRLVTDAAKRWAYTNTNIDRWCELSTVPDYVDFDNSIA